MSIVKINNSEYDDVKLNVKKALEYLESVENIWGENFDNLYNNIITSGYLNSLYEDAISNWHIWKGTITVVATIGGGAMTALKAAPLILAASMTPVGWVALAIAALGTIFGLAYGINQISNKDPEWYTISKEVFENLLANCVVGNNDCYIKATNIYTKLYKTQISLEKIKSLVNEYQQLYADLEAAAKTQGLENKIDLAGDGTTVLGINSDVEVDGKIVTIHASDAMNAMFTYTDTVMSGEIAADYLARTYGYDINYTDIVKNANSFMYNTIDSGLYSHEFIDKILPESYPNAASTYGQAAYDAVTGATGVDLEHIQSALNNTVAGSLALFGGLLGTAFVGNVAKPKNTQPENPTGSGGGGYSGGGGTAPVVTPVVPTPVDPDPVEPDPEEPDPIEPDPEEPVNDIEIEPINEDIELPEEDLVVELNPDGEVDYDAIARDEFEFGQEYDDLIARRTEIIQDIDAKFSSGDLDSIREELKEYGYNSAEIEAIIVDKHKIVKAIIEGDQNAQIAKIARELAEKNGVENFVSKYEGRPDYESLSYEGPSDTLMLPSEDPTIVEAKVTMDEAKTKYEESVATANTLLATAATAKTTMVDLKTKYEEEFGTSDTHMWTEEAANEYNESIKAYNEAATKADEQIKSVEETKNAYYESRKTFEDKKEEYRKKAKEEYEKIEQPPESGNNGETDTMTPDEIQRQIDQSVVVDGDTISFNANQEFVTPETNEAPATVEEGEPIPDLVGVTYEE